MGILIIFAVASVPFAGLAVWRLYVRTGHQGLCGHRNGRDGRWERFSVFSFYVISVVRFSVIGAVLGAIGA
ncbi:MAG: hypothetical protein WBV71_00040 [Roseobacter sp.]